MAKRKLSTAKSQILQQLTERYGRIVTRKQIVEFVGDTSIPFPHWITNDKTVRFGRAQYNLDVLLALGTVGDLGSSQSAGVADSDTLGAGAELSAGAELGSAQ